MNRFGRFDFIAVLLASLVLIACAPSEEAIQIAVQSAIQATADAMPSNTPVPEPTDTPTVTPTYTPQPTDTPAPTDTPTPTHTPTDTPTPSSTPTPSVTPTPSITPTPTETATPTPTATPFNISQCVDFKLTRFAGLPGKIDEAELSSYGGQCIHSFYSKSFGSIYLVPIDYLAHGNINVELVKDNESPDDAPSQVSSPFGEVWGVFEHVPGAGFGESDGDILIRRLVEYPANQAPIAFSGLSAVGSASEMSPGQWKSALLPTETNSCYWARLSPSDGSIRDNHFGIGGMVIRVYEGDIFETNGDCGTWFYVGP